MPCDATTPSQDITIEPFHISESNTNAIILERDHAAESTAISSTESAYTVPLSLSNHIVRIPLTRRDEKDVVYAIIDAQDEERVRKHNWFYVAGYAQSRKCLRMHRFILEVTQRWQIVDHINCNRLDNRRSNLRVCSPAQNAQNKLKTTRTTSSQYIGVSRCVRSNGIKWQVYLAGTYIGAFDSETHAGYAYDQAALQEYGTHARINNISKPEDYIEKKKKQNVKECGRCIKSTSYGTYIVHMTRNGVKSYRTCKSLEEAISFRDNETQRNDCKRKRELESQPIVRNEDGVAIIAVNERGRSPQYALVDDDDYRELQQYAWSIDPQGYAQNNRRGKCSQMSRWIMKETDRTIVIDHINNNRLDNRKANLRKASFSQNSHNRVKSANKDSTYMGVCRSRGKWIGYVAKDGKTYYSGTFDDENVAAWARNCKARDLYGDNARLNDVPDPLNWAWIDGVAKKQTSDGQLLSTRSVGGLKGTSKRTNATGYNGVVKDGSRFAATYSEKRKPKYLGSYPTPEIAAWVRDCKVKELYNGEAALNNVSSPQGWRIVNDRGVFVGESNNDDRNNDVHPIAKKRKVIESIQGIKTGD
jgi:hypothetical protein